MEVRVLALQDNKEEKEYDRTLDSSFLLGGEPHWGMEKAGAFMENQLGITALENYNFNQLQ